MTKKAFMLGTSGGIGSQIFDLMDDYSVVSMGREQINFLEEEGYEEMIAVLNDYEPDVIVNSCGVFGDNSVDFRSVFYVNLRSNWEIIKHYMNNKPKKLVKFIFLGSSSYDGARRNYMLYAASKAGLYSLYQSASEFFRNENLIVGMVSPKKTYTKMISHMVSSDECLDAKYVANKIINFMESLKESSHLVIK